MRDAPRFSDRRADGSSREIRATRDILQKTDDPMTDSFSRAIRCLILGVLVLAARTASSQATVSLGREIWVSSHEFGAISSVRELADGRLLVADRTDNRLVLLSTSGEFVRDIAREGQGPGEYTAVGWVHPLGADSTLFVDSFSSRWSLFFRDRFVTSFAETRLLNRSLDAELAGVDAEGRVVGFGGIRGSPSRPVLRAEADSLNVIRATLDGTQSDSLLRVKGRASRMTMLPPSNGRPATILMGTPFDTEDRIALGRDGSMAIVYTSPYRVDWLRRDGSRIRGAVIESAPARLNREQACAITKTRFNGSSCEAVLGNATSQTLPAFLPTIRHFPEPVVAIEPSGRLLVRRVSADGQSQQYDIIDGRGLRVGRLTLRGDEAVVGFGKDAIYVVRSTEDGIRELRRHLWN